jgi:hypothetical protein
LEIHNVGKFSGTHDGYLDVVRYRFGALIQQADEAAIRANIAERIDDPSMEYTGRINDIVGQGNGKCPAAGLGTYGRYPQEFVQGVREYFI